METVTAKQSNIPEEFQTRQACRLSQHFGGDRKMAGGRMGIRFSGRGQNGTYLHLQPGIILGSMDGVAPVAFQQQVLDFDKYGLKGIYGDAIIVVLAVGVHPTED